MYVDPIDSDDETLACHRSEYQIQATKLESIKRILKTSNKFISQANFRKYEIERWARKQNPGRSFISADELKRKEQVLHWAKSCAMARPDLAFRFKNADREFTFPIPLPWNTDLKPSMSLLQDNYDDWEERYKLIYPSNDDIKPANTFWFHQLDENLQCFFLGIFFMVNLVNQAKELDNFNYADDSQDFELVNSYSQTGGAKLFRRNFMTKSEREEHDFRISMSNQMKRINRNLSLQNRHDRSKPYNNFF